MSVCSDMDVTAPPVHAKEFNPRVVVVADGIAVIKHIYAKQHYL
jgi:hypothetical protein